jgi:hypothetical protein
MLLGYLGLITGTGLYKILVIRCCQQDIILLIPYSGPSLPPSPTCLGDHLHQTWLITYNHQNLHRVLQGLVGEHDI